MKNTKLYKRLVFLFLIIILAGCNTEMPLQEADSRVANNISLNKNSLPNNEYIKVFYTDNTITIDGDEKDWVNAPKHQMRQYFDLGAPIDNKFDLSAYFRMMWDDENLYVFVNVLDDNISVDADPGEPWNMDSFELFMDADNSKDAPGENDPPDWPGTYDENDDQIRFVWETAPFSARGHYDVSQFEYAYLETNDGWNIEIKMPFSALVDFPAEDGHVFGVEFHINDNDNGIRNNFVKWNAESDYTYLYPSLFGSAYLFKSNGN